MIDIFSALLIAVLLSGIVALVLVIVFVVLRRFDHLENSLIPGWNGMVNKLINDLESVNTRVKDLESKIEQTDKHLGWVTVALNYLCDQVLADYPVAVENARRLARGEIPPGEG